MRSEEDSLWYLTRIQRKVGKAVKEHELINRGDRILLAISGGKDSLVMMHALKTRSVNFPFNIDLAAAYVHTENMPYSIDTDYIESLCRNLDIPFSIISTSVNLDSDKNKQACFICSWNRRKELFNFARDNGFNKVSFGHHKDDIIQTLLMNMAFQGSISTMPPRLKMFKGAIEIIRPLTGVTEKECREYARIAGFRDELKICPHEDLTKRKRIEEIINELEKLNPDVRFNLFNSMTNIQDEYLPGYYKEKDGKGSGNLIKPD